MLKDYLDVHEISIYRFAKESNIPYSTLRELALGIVPAERVSSSILKKIAGQLGLSMDITYRICQLRMCRQFTVFKSQVRHDVSDNDLKFVLETVQSHDIEAYYSCKRYAEAFYLLASVDYLSDKYGMEHISSYDHLRTQKLQNRLYPQDVMLRVKLTGDEGIYEKTYCNPYFIKYNIVEGDF